VAAAAGKSLGRCSCAAELYDPGVRVAVSRRSVCGNLNPAGLSRAKTARSLSGGRSVASSDDAVVDSARRANIYGAGSSPSGGASARHRPARTSSLRQQQRQHPAKKAARVAGFEPELFCTESRKRATAREGSSKGGKADREKIIDT
jgi:hypothetical protein